MTTATAALRDIGLFDGCDDAALETVAASITSYRVVEQGDVVCSEGEPADRWWIVDRGTADVTVGGLFLATIGRGETIGELALLDGEPRAATVTATTTMSLFEVDGAGFLDALHAVPGLAVSLLRELAVRLRETNRLRVRAPGPSPSHRVPPAHAAPSVVHLDPEAPGYFDDPYPYFDQLREREAVHVSPALDGYFVLRYDDVHRLARDHSLVGSVATADPASVLAAAASGTPEHAGRTARMMIRRDGPAHVRLRKLVAKVFTPRAVARWERRTEQVVDGLLDAASGRGGFDVIDDFALPLPVTIISEILGMPDDGHAQLREWSRTLTASLDPLVDDDQRERASAASREMFAYVGDVVEHKRRAPADDILTALINAEEDGDTLDNLDVLAQVVLLYIAGHETTTNLIGNGVADLFEHRDQLDRLRTDPVLDANGVEEVLRFGGPTHFSRRVNAGPLTVGGVEIPAGSLITLCLASANRDPRKWGDDAATLDVARPMANEHVSFGGGVHHCLGAALARMEGRVALPRLVRRFPRLEPVGAGRAWYPRMFLRGLESLPVTTG